MTATPHPLASTGLIGSTEPGVREQTSVKSDSLYGLFRARLEELASALKGGDPATLERARGRVLALLRLRELAPAGAQKRLASFEAAIASGTPPDRLVPPMPSQGGNLVALIRELSLQIARSSDSQHSLTLRARGGLVAALEACGLDPLAAQQRAEALVAAWR